MPSLTYTSYVARNTIKFGGTGILVFTLVWVLAGAAIKAYKAAHPPYIKPNVKYGVLPRTVFPEKVFDKKTFGVEMPNDRLPTFKDQARVYFVARSNNTFLALEEDKKTAKQLGFVGEPREVRSGVYEFKNETTNQTLTMNVLDGSFRLKYPYESDQMLLQPGKVPTKAEAITAAKSFLNSANKAADDLTEGEQKVTYWKIEYDGLKSVTSQSEANAIKVDFFRDNLEDSFKIVSADYSSAPISILVTGATVEGKRIAEVNYRYANIERESFATYPILTAEEAVAELKGGNYWPAIDSPGNQTTIRRMYLAYFEPVVLTNYLQPVYVFEGDNNFVAYVPAISEEYIIRN